MSDFYTTLSPLEKAYWHQLAEVFALVNPQQPEKGLITVIQRARNETQNTGEALEQVLERHYQGAKERTERRVVLLNQCPLTSPSVIHPTSLPPVFTMINPARTNSLIR